MNFTSEKPSFAASDWTNDDLSLVIDDRTGKYVTLTTRFKAAMSKWQKDLWMPVQLTVSLLNKKTNLLQQKHNERSNC